METADFPSLFELLSAFWFYLYQILSYLFGFRFGPPSFL